MYMYFLSCPVFVHNWFELLEELHTVSLLVGSTLPPGVAV